jgi:hypothetical protein
MFLTCTSFGQVNYGTTINEKPESLRQGPVVVFTPHVPAKAEQNLIFFLKQDADPPGYKQLTKAS